MTLLWLPDIEYEIKNVFTLYFWDIGFWATMLFDASYKISDNKYGSMLD